MDLPPTSLINSVASSAISHKTNLHVQHTFLYTSLPLFCTTKTLNFLVTHYFYVLTKNFVACVPVRFLFFHTAHFHLDGAGISYFLTVVMKFSCFSSKEIRLLCFQSLALALSILST